VKRYFVLAALLLCCSFAHADYTAQWCVNSSCSAPETLTFGAPAATYGGAPFTFFINENLLTMTFTQPFSSAPFADWLQINWNGDQQYHPPTTGPTPFIFSNINSGATISSAVFLTSLTQYDSGFTYSLPLSAPEPATLLLLAAGIPIALRRRRKGLRAAI
jgi:hypothetical protein